MKIRDQILSSTRMTPVERRMGRFMRAPDHPADSGQNNTGGNPDPEPDSSSSQDNSGQPEDYGTFWNDPKPDDPTPDSSQQTAEPDAGSQLGTQLAQTIQNANFGEAFTREIGEQLAEGNMEGANAQINGMMRQSLQQSVAMTAQIVEAYGKQMQARFEQMIEQRFGSQETQKTLEETFKGMRDPAMAPVIQGVFNQAMAHTKDRAKALEMTRGMLKAMGKSGAADMGLDSPPSNPNDSMGAGPKQLVEDLLKLDD